MKILFISPLRGFHQWGGSEELWSQAALRMAQSGHHVVAMVAERTAPVPQLDELAEAGCHLHYVPLYARSSLAARIYLRIASRIRPPTPAPLERLIRATNPDLVVLSMPGHIVGIDEAVECHRLGVPYMILVQAASLYMGVSDEFSGPMSTAYTSARTCCFVSEGNRNEVETALGHTLPNSVVVRNPFNVPYEAAPAWPAPDGTFRLACVARLEPHAKGQDLLLRVLARPVWRDRPVNVSFVGKGPAGLILQRLSDSLGLKDKVCFTGFTNDIVGAWAEHHALVLPSRLEGLPLALVEAMLCGRPAVVTDVAGNAELLEDGVTGFIAKAPTVDLLDEAMERAWTAHEEWCEIGRRAATSVRRQVGPDPVGDFVALIEAQLKLLR